MKPPLQNTARAHLSDSRLLIVLHTLLETNSVTETALRLSVNKSDISRQLAQLRLALDDKLFIRTKHGLIPTPKAEGLRHVVRAIAEGIEAVFQDGSAQSIASILLDDMWNVPIRAHVAGLAATPANLPEGAPSAKQLSAKYETVGTASPPHRRLAKFCAEVGGGTGHRRPLSRAEADDALGIILEGQADPVQIGTLFGIIHDRGITATELAGFVTAARRYSLNHFGAAAKADLDWPCYTSPYDRRAPWFIIAARLVANAGYRVAMHGSSGSGESGGRLEMAIDAMRIPVCHDAAQAQDMLDTTGIIYLPAYALAPQAYRLLALPGVMGMRNPVHDTMPLLNPCNAPSSILGLSRPAYRTLQRDTAMILGGQDVTVLADVRGAAELNPFRSTTINRLVGGEIVDQHTKRIVLPKTAAQPYLTTMEIWTGIWRGSFSDPKAEAIIIATTAAALLALSGDPLLTHADMLGEAENLWRNRHSTTGKRI